MSPLQSIVLVSSGYYKGILKTRRLINNRNFFLTVLKAEGSKIKSLADTVFGEEHLSAS